MAKTITKDNLFRPAQPGPKKKSDFANSAARAIIKAEADSRDAKTRRLRQARLEMEARQPKPAPAKGRVGKTSKSAAPQRSA